MRSDGMLAAVKVCSHDGVEAEEGHFFSMTKVANSLHDGSLPGNAIIFSSNRRSTLRKLAEIPWHFDTMPEYRWKTAQQCNTVGLLMAQLFVSFHANFQTNLDASFHQAGYVVVGIDGCYHGHSLCSIGEAIRVLPWPNSIRVHIAERGYRIRIE